MDEAEEPGAEAPSSDPGDFVERLRRQAEATENPVYAWDALRAVLNAAAAQGPLEQRATVEIPGWVAGYFLATSQRLNFLSHRINFGPSVSEKGGAGDVERPETIVDLALHPQAKQLVEKRRISAKRAMELVPAALGFQSSGRNAFKDRTKDLNHLVVGLAYESERSRGLSAEDARTAVRQYLDLKIDDRNLQKQIRVGRRLAMREGSKPQG